MASCFLFFAQHLTVYAAPAAGHGRTARRRNGLAAVLAMAQRRASNLADPALVLGHGVGEVFRVALLRAVVDVNHRTRPATAG